MLNPTVPSYKLVLNGSWLQNLEKNSRFFTSIILPTQRRNSRGQRPVQKNFITWRNFYLRLWWNWYKTLAQIITIRGELCWTNYKLHLSCFTQCLSILNQVDSPYLSQVYTWLTWRIRVPLFFPPLRSDEIFKLFSRRPTSAPPSALIQKQITTSVSLHSLLSKLIKDMKSNVNRIPLPWWALIFKLHYLVLIQGWLFFCHACWSVYLIDEFNWYELFVSSRVCSKCYHAYGPPHADIRLRGTR